MTNLLKDLDPKKGDILELMHGGKWIKVRVKRLNPKTLTADVIGGNGGGFRLGWGMRVGTQIRVAEAIAEGDSRGLSLAKDKVSNHLSDETLAYTADLHLDGKKIADMKNAGHGAGDEIRFVDGDDSVLDHLVKEVADLSGSNSYNAYCIVEQFVYWFRTKKADGLDLIDSLVESATMRKGYEDDRKKREDKIAETSWTESDSVEVCDEIKLMTHELIGNSAILKLGDRELDLSHWGFGQNKAKEIMEFLKG